MEQIKLIPSGCQLNYGNSLAGNHLYFAYASTLAIYVYRQSDMKLHKILTGHTKSITCIIWSPYLDNELISSSLEKELIMWDVSTGKIIKRMSCDGHTPYVVAFGTDITNQRIATGGNKGLVRLWNKDYKSFVNRDFQQAGRISVIQFNALQPELFLAGTTNGAICLATTNSHKYDSLNIKPIGSACVSAKWDPLSSEYFVVGYENGTLQLFDLQTKTCKRTFDMVGHMSSVDWIPGIPGGFITADSRSGTLRRWNVAQNAPQKAYKCRPYGFQDFRYMNNSLKAVCSFADGVFGVYDAKYNKFDLLTQGSHSETVFDCKFCPAEPDLLATGGYDGTVKLWNTKKMECVDNLVHSDKPVIFSISWHPTAKRIACAYSNGEVAVWDLEKNRIVTSIKPHKNIIYRVAWNQLMDTLILSTSKDKTCCLIRISDKKVVRQYKHPKTVFGCDWHPMEKNKFATGCHDGNVRIFSAANSTVVKTFRGHTGEVFNVKWSPLLGNLLLSGSNDKTVRCWNVQTETCIELKGHTNYVRALEWSPEIPYICLSGSWDGDIRVWNVKEKTCISIVPYHYSDVYGLAVHPQRPFLFVSSSRDTTVRFCHLNMGTKLLCKILAEPSKSIVGKAPESLANTTFQLHSASARSMLANSKESASAAMQYKQLFEYLQYPHAVSNLWDLAISITSITNGTTESEIHHIDNLLVNLEATAKDLESTAKKRGYVPQKREKLEKAANLFLQIGQIKQYCEIMVMLKRWERAIALAPAVSYDYWQNLIKRYTDVLAEEDDDTVLPFYIVNSEFKKATNFYVTRSALQDALTVTKAAQNGNFEYKQGTSSFSKNIKTDNQDVENIAALLADEYLNRSQPIWAACCYLSVGNERSAVRTLLKGNQISLAYALVVALQMQNQDYARYCMALQCVGFGLVDSAVVVIKKCTNNLFVTKLLCTINDNEAKKAYKDAGMQSMEYYAGKISSASGKDALEFAVLAREHKNATGIAIKELANAFSESEWDWSYIRSIVELLHCVQLDKVAESDRYMALWYCNVVGGQEALWKGYFSICPALIQNARHLCRSHELSVPIDETYIDFMLVHAYAKTDRLEAKNILSQLRAKRDLSEDMESEAKALAGRLTEDLVKSLNSSDNTIVPVASDLPLNTEQARGTTSIITKKAVGTPVFTLENKSSVISVAEATMWFKVNAFSPLNTGERINPF